MLRARPSETLWSFPLTSTKIASDKKTLKSENSASEALSDIILNTLEENSAQDTIRIDIRGKSSVADFMIVSSGRSNRHVNALSDYVVDEIKKTGHKSLGIEGLEACDWVLIDAGDVILHLFRPEVRAFYNLEKIWSVPLPESLRDVAQDIVDEE